MTTRWRLASCALAGMAALVVSSCTSSGGGSSAASSGPPATATAGTSEATAGTPEASPSPPAASAAPSGIPGANLNARALQVTGTIATELTTPWGLAFLPDGSALVSQRDDGQVMLIRDGAATPIGTVPDVMHAGEGGLLGIAVAPTFSADRYLYAYLTTASDNRIVRMAIAPGAESGAPNSLAPPQLLVSGIERGSVHNGGRLLFGPDGMLYASTGDASDRPNSQDSDSLNGKILRMSPDGSPAPGNPDPGSRVFSLGHRNVQGLAFDADGRLWASEFGQDTWDELNLIVPGGNYGWPAVEGKAGDSRFRDPIAQWRTSDASPSGIAIIGDSVVMAGLRGTRLWVIPVSGGALAGEPTSLLDGQLGRLRTIAVAPDGSVWLMTSNTDGRGSKGAQDDRILRLGD